MAKTAKYDGIVEAVHYKPDGSVAWVRAYERRGPTWSDHVLIPRAEFIEKLKSGKSFLVGTRLEHLAGTFDVSVPVQVVQNGGQEYLVSGEPAPVQHDRLEHVPAI